MEAVELIKKRKAPRIPQDDSKATYEPPCDDRVAAVDFAKPIIEVYNLVRGCDPQPGAYTTFRSKKVRLYEASIHSEGGERTPGEIVSIEEKGLVISLKGGTVRIGKARVDKGEKVGPPEFARIVGLKPGDRFGE